MANRCEASMRSVRGYQAAVCVHVDKQSACFGGDEADFALQTMVECQRRGGGTSPGQVALSCHEGEVGLSLPMSLEEEKTKEFAVHACRGASDGSAQAGKKEML